MRKLNAIYLTPLLLSLMPAQAQAQESDLNLEDILNIEPVVYSASKKEQSTKFAPQVVTIITPQEMKRFGVNTIHEALALVPGMDLQRQLRKEFLWTRGVRESALILLDGTSLVNPLDNEILLDKAFNIEMIKRIEVLRGPAGVLWGTNAFLGLVNIITKDPTKSPFNYVTTSAGSFEQKKVAGAFSNTIGNVGYFVSGHYWTGKKQDVEIKNTASATDVEGLHKESYWGDLFVKLTYKDWKFTYKKDSQKDYSPLTDITTTVYTKDPFWERDDTELVDIRKTINLSSKLKMTGKAWYLNRKTTIWLPFDDIVTKYLKLDGFENSVYGLDFLFNYDISEKDELVWGITHTQTIGGDQRQDDFGITTGGVFTTTNFGVAHAKYKSYSGYLQNTRKMNKSWRVGAGVRYEFFEQKAKQAEGESFKSRDVEPQAIVNLNSVKVYDDESTLKFVLSSGYRRPDIEQTFSKVNFVGNSDLKDEKALTFEVDYNWKINKKFSWQNNYSINRIEDLIDFKKDSSTDNFVADNLDVAIIHTVESEFKFNFESGSFGKVNLSYKYGRTDNDKEFSIENTNKINMNALYSHKFNERTYLTTIGRYVGSKKDNHAKDDGFSPESNPPERELDPYFTIDLGVEYNDALIENLTARAFIYNILDTEYYHQNRPSKTGYLHIQPGRSFMASLDYTF